MHTNFDRFKFQCSIESEIGCLELDKWDNYRAQFKQFKITQNNVDLLKSALQSDTQDYYFKGLLTLLEGINNIAMGSYSWSIVKLYYSIFYFIRCYFGENLYGFAKNGGIYVILLSEGEVFERIDNLTFKSKKMSGDHKSTLNYFRKTFPSSILLSNKINDEDSLDWIRWHRETVNYRQRAFDEPNNKYFNSDLLDKTKLASLIKKYILDEEFIYCFNEDHSMLALPLKYLQVVTKKLSDDTFIDKDRLKLINNLLSSIGFEDFNEFKKLVTSIEFS